MRFLFARPLAIESGRQTDGATESAESKT